jgi:KDO2-lipid IV(A) lauroyltransferase
MYELVIHPALEPPQGGTVEENVLKTTAISTKMIETEIRRTPGFWLWFHDRWRTRPLDEHEKHP